MRPASWSLALLTLVVAGIAVLAAPPPARAHDGEGAALVVTEAVRPGTLLEVTGADFSAGALVDIGLSSGLGTRALSTVEAGPDGHFFDAILVPDDVPGGIWEVRVRDATGVAAVATVVVDAPAGSVIAPAAPANGHDLAGLVSLGLALGLAVVAGVVALRLVRRATAQPAR